jgi:hypothetical protein
VLGRNKESMSRPEPIVGTITFMVSVPASEQSRIDDIAEEYAVETDRSIPGGCIIWGRYNGVWNANASARWLVNHLLKTKQDAE